MSDSERFVWIVGGLSEAHQGDWTISTARELGEDEFAELERKIAFVVDVASQTDYARLADAVARFDALLITAQSELETSKRVSPRTAAALKLDLPATMQAAHRFEANLLGKVDAAAELPRPDAAAFRSARDYVRASNPYLIAQERARGAAAGELSLVLRDGEVCFDVDVKRSAREVATGLLGVMFWLVGAYLNANRRRVECVAAELEREASAVSSGAPCLIKYRVEQSLPGPITLKDIPLREIAALRRFYVEGSAAQGPEELVRAASVLASANLRTDVDVGGVDISAALIDGGASEGLGQLPAATLELDLRLLGSTPVDYWAPAHYAIAQGEHERQFFVGAVQSASGDDDRVVLYCEGVANLIERASGGTLASGFRKDDLVRSLLLAADLPADALMLETPAHDPQEERFEVVLPIRGVTVKEPLALGGVQILPTDYGEEALEGLERDGPIAARVRAAFADAGSYGRAFVTEATVPGAEDAGISAIETAVAWLVTRVRYGLARLPDGSVQSFGRQESLRAPETGSAVLVRGTATARLWLRLRRIEERPLTRGLDRESPLLNPALSAELSAEERYALMALRRATSEAVLENQLHALWEAIEFYAAETTIDKLFTRAQRKLLQESPPEWLNAEQRLRYIDAMNGLNHVRVRERVELQLERDGVPLTKEERDLLFKTLRDARNSPAHGRVPNRPTRAEIHRGLSIVARMLVYRMARREKDAATEQ